MYEYSSEELYRWKSLNLAFLAENCLETPALVFLCIHRSDNSVNGNDLNSQNDLNKSILTKRTNKPNDISTRTDGFTYFW